MTTSSPRTIGGFAGIGALAGVFAAFTFTVVHQLVISAIWFALPAMLVAGALCGTCIAWSYLSVVRTPSLASWLRYNLIYLVMFVALGGVSMFTFDPVTTIAALLATTEPPVALIGQALPLTGMFIVAAAALLTLLYRPSLTGAIAILVTVAVLVLLLGLNISILGFVDVPSGEVQVLGETLGLLLALTSTYAVGVLAIVRKGPPFHRSA